jgi:PAS domain S-box-containing protein
VAKPRLLIVDEIVTARGLAERLAALGYDVVGVASSDDQAVADTATTAPDLVLLHLARSDERDGVAINDLRRHWRIPVLFVIAAADESGLRRAGVTEPYGYILAPFTDRDLDITIDLAICRHDAARAARAVEDRFFASSIDMLCFLDFSGHFTRLNPAWERTLGFTREELMARPFIEFVHPDDRERTLKQNADVRAGGHARAFENRYLCKDGSYRWLHWNAAPDSSERVIYSVARDVTQIKQADEERDQLVRKLQAALAEVRTLQEILPICSYCRKIRDDEDYWHTVESYVARHTATRFSHSICPSCMASEVEPQFADLGDQ